MGLSITEKTERITKFFKTLSEDKNISLSTAAMKDLRTSDALIAFQRLGLCTKVDGYWIFTKSLASFDSDDIKLMAMESWFVDRTKREKLESPAENAAPMPQISHTEEIAKHMAKIGELLGFQFQGKTPPGLWQMIKNQEQELIKLRKEKVEMLKDIEMLTSIKGKYRRD
jgi:hypothetical protein